MQQTSMQALLKMLHIDDEIVAPLVFSVLSFLGKYKPLGKMSCIVIPYNSRDESYVSRKFEKLEVQMKDKIEER